MTTHFRSLMFVAAVAILPVACGTSSPMGTDLAALEAGAQVSSFRSDVPVPPQAPEPQSPESDTVPAPAPAEPGEIPGEDPKDPQDDPRSIELPASRPALPSDNADPVPSPAPPNGETAPDPAPPSDTVPPAGDPRGVPPPTGDPNGVPAPPIGDPNGVPVPPTTALPCVPTNNVVGCTPAPSPLPPTDPVECQAASIELVATGPTFVAPSGEGFMATLTDKGGSLIEDGSCEKLVWAVEGPRNQSRFVIHYANDSRYIYIEGMQGAYKVGVTAPNGVTTSIRFEVK